MKPKRGLLRIPGACRSIPSEKLGCAVQPDGPGGRHGPGGRPDRAATMTRTSPSKTAAWPPWHCAAALGLGRGLRLVIPDRPADELVVTAPDFTLQGCTYVLDGTVPAGEPEGVQPILPPSHLTRRPPRRSRR